MRIFVIYIGLIYYRLVATTENRDAIYHMGIWFILATIVAPYVYMWSMGLFSVYEIHLYRKKISGIVYKNSLNRLALGLGWLIVASIGVQYLTTLTARFKQWSIYELLAVVYALLLVLSVGFVLLALGARDMKKIEEV